jgi:hemerythrin-like metal-binding protein
MTTFMPWREEYSVGDDSIDSQHKEIIELINDLHRVLSLNGGNSTVAVKGILEQLMHYTIKHFQYEEKILQACGYPDIENHKAMHGRLQRRTAAMRTNMYAVTDRDLLGYLRDWWSDHILTQDKAYSPYLAVRVH